MKRRHSDEDLQPRSSPSNASSHGDGNVADTEMDAGPSGASGAENSRQVGEKRRDTTPLPVLSVPAKKKRTRTLTTPHQSTVLHALLAQSRFPTTAMREEVGRSIGLSARKVQVWFQNQRQKARRPLNQSSTPLARPPQYGAFTNAPAPDLAPSTAGPSSLPSAEGRSPFHAAPFTPLNPFEMNREHSSPDDFLGVSVSGTSPRSGGHGSSHHLSGPGVPGTSSTLAPRFSLPLMPQPVPVPTSHVPKLPPSSNFHQLAPPLPPPRDFTSFNPPFPPLLQVVPEVGSSGASQFGQGRFPPPGRRRRLAASSPLPGEPPQTQTQTQTQAQAQTQARQEVPFASSESHPQVRACAHNTPSSFLVPHHRSESARDLARLHIAPLHVPESPRVGQLYTSPYSSPRDPVRSRSRSPQRLSERRALFSGDISGPPPPPPLPLPPPHPHGTSPPTALPRTRRFDPVREAASERRCSSQGTDRSTPLRANTPHV